MARKSRQVETRMLSEYLLKNYGTFPFIMDIPLGRVDEALMAAQGYQQAINMSRPFRPRADAIVILPRYLVLVEAKVWNVINGLAKLPLYKTLIPFTPELKQYLPREVLMELVVGSTPANLEIMARAHDVKLVVFTPDWLKDVVDSMNKYWTPEYQRQRQDKIAMREYYGLE